jgi:Flp pilus assembly protein CpaB
MNYSVRNIVIAGGLAVVAVIAVLLYTSGVRNKAQENQHRVQVLVASRDIAPGTTGAQVISQHLLVPKAVVQTDQIPGALTSLTGLDNLVVSQTIYHGQQAPSAVFQTPLSTGTGLQIRGAERVMSLPVDQDSGLIGTLKDGDHIDIMIALSGDSTTGSAAGSFTRPLLRNVTVITAPTTDDTHILLKVSDTDAEKLFYAQQYYKVWFVQRPQVGAQDSPLALETAAGLLFDGFTPQQIASSLNNLKAFTKSINSAQAGN